MMRGLGGMQGKMAPGGCPECLPVENFRDFKSGARCKAARQLFRRFQYLPGIEYRPFIQGEWPDFVVANHLNYLAIYRLGK